MFTVQVLSCLPVRTKKVFKLYLEESGANECLGEKGVLALAVLIFSFCLILVSERHLERGCFYLKFNIYNAYIMVCKLQ